MVAEGKADDDDDSKDNETIEEASESDSVTVERADRGMGARGGDDACAGAAANMPSAV